MALTIKTFLSVIMIIEYYFQLIFHKKNFKDMEYDLYDLGIAIKQGVFSLHLFPSITMIRSQSSNYSQDNHLRPRNGGDAI